MDLQFGVGAAINGISSKGWVTQSFFGYIFETAISVSKMEV
jgi:hypothetical protein